MKQIQEAYIVAATRSPIGRSGRGYFRNLRPDDLLVKVLQSALAQVPTLDHKMIEDLICGCAMPEGQQGLNVARTAVVLAGLPKSVGGITVNRFCASGLSAIQMAADRIRVGEADVMIAGGAEATVCALGIAGFCAMHALSTRNDAPSKACRPFDANRDGFIMGEGAGIVVLETLEHARKRGAQIYAEVAGYGATCDANHITAPVEGGEGAARAMTLAMREGGLTPDDVDYVNAHGTSTKLNDKTETDAIKGALGFDRAHKIMVGSSKSMTGHMLGAAGAIETIVCALTMKHGVVTPTINYETHDPLCDLDYVPNTARTTKVRACLNNSLGFGGHNATLLLKSV